MVDILNKPTSDILVILMKNMFAINKIILVDDLSGARVVGSSESRGSIQNWSLSIPIWSR